MRKLFRFKYEPCKGDCYAWCDYLPRELNKMSEIDRKLTVETMVKAHDHLCDNPDYSFGIDLDSSETIFIAHFRSPEGIDLLTNKSFFALAQEISKRVLSTNIPQITGACSYGNNGTEDLGNEILRACLDEVYRKEHHDSCPCTIRTQEKYGAL